MNTFVFDIETIPDVQAGRRINDLPPELSDKAVADVMFHKRREQTGGSDFLNHHLHRVAAISVALRTPTSFKVWSLGAVESDEADILARFFGGIDKYTPTLVTWNGSGFDLPVLHYRSLVHGINCAKYWDVGNDDRDFKWNNYISRYHWRHTDLMDVLAGFSPRANAPLDEVATLLGFPGKMGMSGAKVWDQFQEGNLEGIRNYCETDVLNTYLVYLRFQLVRGVLTQAGYQVELDLVRTSLQAESKPHLDEFLQHWKQS